MGLLQIDEHRQLKLLVPERRVMDVFVGDFPETASMPELQRLVSERAGKPETLAAVKRALQEARAKVRKLLVDKGYNFGKQGEL